MKLPDYPNPPLVSQQLQQELQLLVVSDSSFAVVDRVWDHRGPYQVGLQSENLHQGWLWAAELEETGCHWRTRLQLHHH